MLTLRAPDEMTSCGLTYQELLRSVKRYRTRYLKLITAVYLETMLRSPVHHSYLCHILLGEYKGDVNAVIDAFPETMRKRLVSLLEIFREDQTNSSWVLTQMVALEKENGGDFARQFAQEANQIRRTMLAFIYTFVEEL